MARFFAVTLLLSLALACLAVPHHEDADHPMTQAPLTLLPPSESGDLKFFFPFNFWNLFNFRPLPWIPLPGLIQTTAAPEGEEPAGPAPGGEDGDAPAPGGEDGDAPAPDGEDGDAPAPDGEDGDAPAPDGDGEEE